MNAKGHGLRVLIPRRPGPGRDPGLPRPVHQAVWLWKGPQPPSHGGGGERVGVPRREAPKLRQQPVEFSQSEHAVRNHACNENSFAPHDSPPALLPPPARDATGPCGSAARPARPVACGA